MRTTAKIGLSIVMLGAVCLFAGVAEGFVRSKFGGAMTIAGVPIDGAKIEGTWQPDFLWAGKAWRIQVQCEAPLEILLDEKSYVVPGGAHVLYSHHDHTNTGRFGREKFWGYPKQIVVRSLPAKPEPSNAADSRENRS